MIKKIYIKIDLLFRSMIDWFYIDYRHNRDDCVLVDERHVLGVMSRPQRPQGGAHVSAQPDRWRQLQNQHQHRWHPTDQVLLRVSRGVCVWKIDFLLRWTYLYLFIIAYVTLLAHLNRKFEWAFLIIRCSSSSVRPLSACCCLTYSLKPLMGRDPKSFK